MTLPGPTQMRATEGETDNRPREGTLYLSRVSHRHRTTHLRRFSQFYYCRRHDGFPWLHCSCSDTAVKYNMKQRFLTGLRAKRLVPRLTDFLVINYYAEFHPRRVLYQLITYLVKDILFSCDGENDLLYRCQSQMFHNRPVCQNVYHYKKFYKVYLLSSSIMFQTTISTT